MGTEKRTPAARTREEVETILCYVLQLYEQSFLVTVNAVHCLAVLPPPLRPGFYTPLPVPIGQARLAQYFGQPSNS